MSRYDFDLDEWLDDTGCATRDVVPVALLMLLAACVVATAIIVAVARWWPW